MSGPSLTMSPGALSPPTLVESRLEEIARESSNEFVAEITQIFVTDVEERLATLSSVVVARDAAGVCVAAHSVQGAASTLGVMLLGSLAAALERYAERGDWRKADWALERLRAELFHVKAALGELSDAPGD